MTSSPPRWASLALIAVAAGGLLLRLVPLLRAGGPLAMPVDYDEAVYFSASALLFKGVLPTATSSSCILPASPTFSD